MPQEVIVVGASVRAAAWSAWRAGFVSWAADLFADRDLGRVARTNRIAPGNFPRGLRRALADAPAVPWLFTGGLENRPGLIARIAQERRLWGNGPNVLRRVRDPFLLADCLRQAGLPGPAVAKMGDDSRRWLLKPLASGGGRGIRFWDGDPPLRGRYVQEWIDGEPRAAIYVGQTDGGAQFVGVTRQLIGSPGTPFGYRGSIGPLPLTASEHGVYQRLGDTLAHAFGLLGLFGVDCLVRDGVPYPVEVNPRYTASMEILEWALKIPLLARHAAAFGEAVSPAVVDETPPSPILGKAILYAESDVIFPEFGPWDETLEKPGSPWQMPDFADIPHPGERFEAGQPMLTIFARADSVAECEERLTHVRNSLQ